ncbi:MAG TPA: hypothetical protein VH229_04085 [Candidatus Udaeobacter sp.]|nr:hypothetical protein [Candidatus Udaeobacter sp.]
MSKWVEERFQCAFNDPGTDWDQASVAVRRNVDTARPIAGVKIAWTATKAARSSRSWRARRISINPKTTVERSTGAICSGAPFDAMQI